MSNSMGDTYFDLNSVIESSHLFGYGRTSYRVIKKWRLPASQTYKVRMLGRDCDIVFIKLLNRNEDEILKHQILITNEYNMLKLLYDKCHSSEYGVVEPLECVKSKLALITRAEEGQMLDQLLLNIRHFRSIGRSQILNAMKAAGMWLRSLFESTISFENNINFRKRVQDDIDRGLSIIRRYQNSGEWISWESRLASYVEAAMDSVDGEALKESFCHGDFGPWNILVSKNGKIVVMDLTDVRKGLIYDDIASLWHWLDDLRKRRFWHKEKDIEEMKLHFLSGFFPDQIPWGVLNIFLVKLGIRKVCRMIQKEPDSIISDLIKERWLGGFLKEKRVDYWKSRLLTIAADQRGIVSGD